MRIIDPGHQYALRHLDGDSEEIVTFVKREGPGYPGNAGHHPGTNIQEVLRMCIDRLKYLDNQIEDAANTLVIDNLRTALCILDHRAARRHGRTWTIPTGAVELLPVCVICGHIDCFETCVIPALTETERAAKALQTQADGPQAHAGRNEDGG